MPNTLLEIAAEARELQELLEDEGGDITEREAEVDDWLVKQDRKLDSYCRLITELEARSAVRKHESARLVYRSRVDQDKADWLRGRLHHYFLLTGQKSLETDLHRITLAKHGGKVPVVIHVSPDRLPEVFRKVRVDIKPDVDAIRTHLEAAGPITDNEGTTLAELGRRGSSIRIR